MSAVEETPSEVLILCRNGSRHRELGSAAPLTADVFQVSQLINKINVQHEADLTVSELQSWECSLMQRDTLETCGLHILSPS